MIAVMVYLAFSAVLLAIAMYIRGRNASVQFLLGLSWLLITAFGLCLAPLLFLNSLALMVLVFGGWMFSVRPRIVLSLSLAATACLYAWFLYLAIDIAHERARLWAENQPRSLEHRLEYEQSITFPTASERPTPAPPASAPDAEAEADKNKERAYRNLAELAYEDMGTDTWRKKSLRFLQTMHYDNVLDFINSEGFGDGRRLRPRASVIDLPPLPYLPQQEPPPPDLATFDRSPGEMLPEKRPPTGNQPPDDEHLANADEKAGDEKGNPAEGNVTPHDSERVRGPQPPTTDQLQEFHLAGTIDFVNAPGFGYIPSQKGSGTPFGDLSRVMGFQPHAFRKPPGIRRAPGTQATWLIDRLELVSLLKHSEPAVYISKHLPRMDELSEATTRPLSDFESQALPKLRAGEELVIDTQPGEIRMLGAVRAITRCLDCHRAREGDLLGAFTYRLLSTPPPAAKAVNDPAL